MDASDVQLADRETAAILRTKKRIAELEAEVKQLRLVVDASIGALEDNNASDALTYLKVASGLPKSTNT